MPYRISLPLQTQAYISFLDTPHRALQGTLYAWLNAAAPTLAAALHDLPDLKPFTVMPLHRRDGGVYFTFSLLDDRLWSALEGVLQQGAEVQIADDRWPLDWAGRQVHHLSYPELVVSAGVETRFALRFLSPTSFHSQDMHYPLPDPFLAFQSWLLRWNVFAPEELRLNVNTLDLVSAHVAVGRHRIETREVRFNRFGQVGFVGTVAFQVIKENLLSDDLLRRFNILADYAPFCGTGHKTTQGMGWTERLR